MNGCRRYSPLDEDTLRTARWLLGQGLSFNAVSQTLNVHRPTLRRRLDPMYRLNQNEQASQRHSKAEDARNPTAPPQHATYPDDLTGTICGDPGPGRSALDRKIKEHFK